MLVIICTFIKKTLVHMHSCTHKCNTCHMNIFKSIVCAREKMILGYQVNKVRLT